METTRRGKRQPKKEKDPNMRTCKACVRDFPIDTYQKYGQDKVRRVCNECLDKIEAIKTPKPKQKTNRAMMEELSEKLEVLAQKESNGGMLEVLEERIEMRIDNLRKDIGSEFEAMKEEILRMLQERSEADKMLLEEIRDPALAQTVETELKEWRKLVEQFGSRERGDEMTLTCIASPKTGSASSSTVGSGANTPGGTKGRKSPYAVQVVSQEWIDRLKDDELLRDINRITGSKSTSKGNKTVMEFLSINQDNLIKERNRRGLKPK